MKNSFTHLMRFSAAMGLFLASAVPVLAADSTPPVVSAVSPTMASQGSATVFSATYSDQEFAGQPLPSCSLSEDGVSLGAMTITGTRGAGTASLEHVFTVVGTHNLRVNCADSDFNAGTGPVTAVTIPAAGTIGSLSPTTATAGVATTFAVAYSGFNAPYTAASCSLIKVLDGSTLASMTMSGGAGSANGTASASYTFTTAGSFGVYVSCLETGGTNTYRYSPTATVVVASASADIMAPTVGAVSYTALSVGAPVTFQAAVSDNVGVTACDLYINSSLDGAMTISGGLASRARTFSSAGNNSAYVRCRDAGANFTSSAVVAFTVGGSDITPPVVGQIQQSSASVGGSLNLTATYSDNAGVTSCDLYVNGNNQGSMTLYGSYAQRSFTFSTAGSYSAYTLCRDAAGNSTTGVTRTVTVSASGTVAFGTLVKLMCPSGAAVNHPCKAVYYYGSDNRRHAFPNEKVYFTWYANFDSVVEVNDVTMANLSLGTNVNYRPGIRMVKFTTVPKVYAVGRRGELRWVTTEAVAIGLYGSNWNRNIDDISDVFYANYTFGADINNAGQYNPSAEAASTLTIDANL